tara:strand:- start:153 stop:404 length:252 start_codon:yes stop_codon:yes gene_type:complete
MKNTYRVTVPEDTDFFEGWTDSRVPNMVFLYDQESIEECEEIDGVYYATYETWVVTEPRQMEYVQPDGTHVVIDIPIGEYGKR